MCFLQSCSIFGGIGSTVGLFLPSMFIVQLEEGQYKMQSRLEEEEDAKAALMSRIQRLTKLILVSSKNAIPGYMNDMPSHQRSLSAAEDDVSCYSHLLILQGMFKQMYLLYFWPFIVVAVALNLAFIV